jgi:hypothetical protein
VVIRHTKDTGDSLPSHLILLFELVLRSRTRQRGSRFLVYISLVTVLQQEGFSTPSNGGPGLAINKLAS